MTTRCVQLSGGHFLEHGYNFLCVWCPVHFYSSLLVVDERDAGKRLEVGNGRATAEIH
jgi:hypothetical protein